MRPNKPKVSVIMSVYNDHLHLRQAINSIINQSFKNFEFIIVDDYSNKKTKKILKNFNNKKFIKIIKNKKNLGLARSLNLAIKRSKGEYIARIDADDYSYKSRLKEQLVCFKRNSNLSILGSNAIIYDKSKNSKKTKLPLTNNDIIKSLLYKNPLMHSSIMFKKIFIKQIGGYNEDYLRCQDYELWLRARKEFEFKNLGKALIFYRTKNDFSFKSLFYTLTAISKYVLFSKNVIYGFYGLIISILKFLKIKTTNIFY